MNAAAQSTWQAIRQRHRGKIPAALVAIVPGPGTDGGMIDWANSPVVQLPSQAVSDGPETVLAYLLHQAAHGWLHGDGGESLTRWHNPAYRDRATSLLLDVAEAPPSTRLGWAQTSITEAAVRAYGDQIGALAAAAPGWEPPEHLREWNPGRNGITARCSCPDSLTIRIRGVDAPQKLADHPVLCAVCGQPFQPA